MILKQVNPQDVKFGDTLYVIEGRHKYVVIVTSNPSTKPMSQGYYFKCRSILNPLKPEFEIGGIPMYCPWLYELPLDK